MIELLETPIPSNSPLLTKERLSQAPDAEIHFVQQKSRKSTAESEYSSAIYSNLIAESSDEEESDTEENKTLASVEEASSESTFSLTREEISLIRAARSLTKPRFSLIAERSILLGMKQRPKTLVLDLDETLVFSKKLTPAQVLSLESTHPQPSGLVSVGTQKFHVQERPFLREFLGDVARHFELVVFTASVPEYATQVCNLIDPDHTLFKAVLHRSHCIELENELYIKDLRIFADRSPSDLVIVDNFVPGVSYDLSNIVPIESFTGAVDDSELPILKELLEKLSVAPDVRLILTQLFAIDEAVFASFDSRSPSWSGSPCVSLGDIPQLTPCFPWDFECPST